LDGLAANCRGVRETGSTPRRRHRRAVLGVVHDQTESNTNERPEQRPDNDQELTATAKRTVHKASELETDLQHVAIPDTLKPEEVGAPRPLEPAPRTGCDWRTAVWVHEPRSTPHRITA
jgi:hypothetical protein